MAYPKSVAILLLGCGVAGTAAAEGTGIYAGVSAGRAHFHANAIDIDSALTAQGFTSSSTVDNRHTGMKGYLGYLFAPHFAFEVGYVNLGKLSVNTNISAAPSGYDTGLLQGEFKASAGVYADAIGIVPLGKGFSIFGRLGLYDIRAKLTVIGPSGTFEDSATKANLHWGVGASYEITRSLSARVEFERFHNVGDADKTSRGDIDLVSGGVVYRF